jgi:ADP-ribose pyrophosphatase
MPSPGFSAEKMTVFLATGLTQGEAKPMDDERIEAKWFSKKEVKDLIRTNRITDGKTMIGFLCWANL